MSELLRQNSRGTNGTLREIRPEYYNSQKENKKKAHHPLEPLNSIRSCFFHTYTIVRNSKNQLLIGNSRLFFYGLFLGNVRRSECIDAGHRFHCWNYESSCRSLTGTGHGDYCRTRTCIFSSSRCDYRSR